MSIRLSDLGLSVFIACISGLINLTQMPPLKMPDAAATQSAARCCGINLHVVTDIPFFNHICYLDSVLNTEPSHSTAKTSTRQHPDYPVSVQRFVRVVSASSHIATRHYGQWRLPRHRLRQRRLISRNCAVDEMPERHTRRRAHQPTAVGLLA